MTIPAQIVLLLATGLGAICSLVRAERGYQILFHTGWVGPGPIPSTSNFFLFGSLGVILTLIFLVLGMSIVYRCYSQKP